MYVNSFTGYISLTGTVEPFSTCDLSNIGQYGQIIFQSTSTNLLSHPHCMTS